jgi:hypothetical protein
MEDVGMYIFWCNLGPHGIHSLRPFRIFYCHLEYFSRFGMLYEEKSGNPAYRRSLVLRMYLQPNRH